MTQHKVLHRIERYGPKTYSLTDSVADFLKFERLQQPEDLDILTFALLAHAGFKKIMHRGELLGQLPPLQWSCLIERLGLHLQQWKIMERIVYKILFLVGAFMAGDLLGPATDDEFMNISPDMNLTMAVRYGNGIIVCFVANL